MDHIRERSVCGVKSSRVSLILDAQRAGTLLTEKNTKNRKEIQTQNVIIFGCLDILCIYFECIQHPVTIPYVRTEL